MKKLVSLFDYSGNWSAPFARRGWEVIRWDIKIHPSMNVFNITGKEAAIDMFGNVNGLIMAPPCDDFAASGARHWKNKDADGRTNNSKAIIRKCLDIVSYLTPDDGIKSTDFFWAMENPVGRLNTLFPELNKPWYFNPFDYAGHLMPTESDIQMLNSIREKNGHGVTRDEYEFVVKKEAYTKKTGLWGNFNRNLIVISIPPVKCAPQGSFTQRIGGKSAKIKEKRSNTPTGFAEAFCLANDK